MSHYFSKEGLEKLKKELDERKGATRVDINKRILTAKEMGDLKENAEYIEAKEAQSMNEGRIAELEDIIREAEIVVPQHLGTIDVGSTVKVRSARGEQQFTIVGPAESNPIQGFISNESPIGRSLMTHKKDDEIEVKTPGGITKYTILEVL